MCELTSTDRLIASGEAREAFEHAAACGSCQADLIAQGAYPPGCEAPLLGHEVLLHLDTLGDGQGPAHLDAHLSTCPACRLEVEDARAVLEELEPPPSARISPTCPACEERVEREHAVTCTTCASPHHPGCFDARGRCGLSGCDARGYVRRIPPRRGTFPRWLLGGLLGLVVTAAAEPSPAVVPGRPTDLGLRPTTPSDRLGRGLQGTAGARPRPLPSPPLRLRSPERAPTPARVAATTRPRAAARPCVRPSLRPQPGVAWPRGRFRARSSLTLARCA